MGGFSMSILLLAMAGMFWAFVIVIVILAIIKLALYVFESVLFILGYIFAGINSLLILTIILVIVTFIVEMIIVSKLYTKYSKYNEVLTVFTAVTLGLLEPIFIFAIRNNKNRS